jgi:hypothetical protein
VVYIDNGILFSHKKNEIFSFTSKCMELKNIILVKLGSEGQTLHVLPYADCRPKKNAVILLDMDHTKGRPSIGGIGQGK